MKREERRAEWHYSRWRWRKIDVVQYMTREVII